jgi:hypothetical protein
VIARYYVRTELLHEFYQAVLAFPGSLRPTHFGDSEEVSLTPGNSLGTAVGRYMTLVSEMPTGFFLGNGGVLYDLSLQKYDPWSQVFVCKADGSLPFTDDEVTSLIAAAAGVEGVDFFVLCDPEEFRSRNSVVKKFGSRTVEGWVGRDIRRYIPGLYWRTFVSTELLVRHGSSFDSVPAFIAAEERERGVLLSSVVNHDAWAEVAEEVEGFCEATQGVFSVRAVREQADHAGTILDLLDLFPGYP